MKARANIKKLKHIVNEIRLLKILKAMEGKMDDAWRSVAIGCPMPAGFIELDAELRKIAKEERIITLHFPEEVYVNNPCKLIQVAN